jgi:hypothetical protein
MVCRKPDIRRAGKSCAVKVARYKQMDSTRHHRELVESRQRLTNALDEVTGLVPSRVARNQVASAAECYALALENYREALLSELAVQ